MRAHTAAAGAMTDVPKVSVCMLAYNHEAFIADAIESVLSQEAPFLIELVIGEDCSTDATRDIIVGYHRRFPGRIRLVLQERRVGPRENGFDTVHACRGQYLAFLEGDDYWVDPFKLRDQVALLDANPDAFLCGARARLWRFGDTTPSDVMPGDPSETLATYGARELFESRWWFRTCTKVFRRDTMWSMPKRFGGDWLATMWAIARTNFGKVCFLDRVVGVYREHAGGIWTSMPPHGRLGKDIRALFDLIPLYRGADREQLQALMLEHCETLVRSPDAPSAERRLCAALTVRRSPLTRQSWRCLLASLRL